MEFLPKKYGSWFEPLLDVDRRRPLNAGEPQKAHLQALRLMSVANAFSDVEVNDPEMARCCLSAVWLLHDYLDESHTLIQRIDSLEGSLWHGVMHRREGDYSNAKYWFHRAGDHPVCASLATRLGGWDPFDFVDRCEAAARQGKEIDACLDAQEAEWEMLFDWCHQRATR